MACVVAQLSSFFTCTDFLGHFLNFFVYKKLSKTAPGSPSNRAYQIGYNYKLANTKDISELDFFFFKPCHPAVSYNSHFVSGNLEMPLECNPVNSIEIYVILSSPLKLKLQEVYVSWVFSASISRLKTLLQEGFQRCCHTLAFHFSRPWWSTLRT